MTQNLSSMVCDPTMHGGGLGALLTTTEKSLTGLTLNDFQILSDILYLANWIKLLINTMVIKIVNATVNS